MGLGFTPLAERDLVAIADYIAIDNPRRAVSFARELRQQCERMRATRWVIDCGQNWVRKSALASTAAM